MDTPEKQTLKKSTAAEAVVDGLHAAAYEGVQRPIDAIKQSAHHLLGIDLPNAQFIDAPPKVAQSSAAGIAETIGAGIGMVPWVYASHKIAGSIAPHLGLDAEKLLTSKSLNIARAGLTGATFSTLFKPVDEGHGNFFLEKTEDAGISFTTFAAGAGVSRALAPRLGILETKAARIAASSSIGAISGVGAGAVNAELNNLTGHEHVSPLRTGLEYGALGSILGANSSGEFKQTGKRLMSFDEPGENNIFGENPQKLISRLDAVKSAHGENSVEHADYLMRIGDAHMTQGSLANPEAQLNYEQALKICTDTNQSDAMLGKAYDKLAIVKESSGDTRGAASDLGKALEHWHKEPVSPDLSKSSYLVRRQEDLQRLERVNKVKYGRQPTPEE